MSEDKIKVLVIDDEEGLADFMQRILQLKGFLANMETDGVRAVELFKKDRADIVLIDVALGYSQIDGIEVLKQIKDIDSQTVCVMVTRVTDPEPVEQAKALGALHYLLKPLDSKDMVGVVNEAAQLVKQRRARG